MSHTTSLLRRVRSRIAAAAAVEDLQRGLAVGGAAAVLTLAGDRLAWFEADLLLATGIGLGVAVTVPLAGLLVRRLDARATAALADDRLGLRERLSTALWCRSGAAAGAGDGAHAEPLGALVIEDADGVAARIQSRDVARAFRPRLLRRPLAVAGLAVLGCAGLLAWQPAARALESDADKAARLAAENRVAEVARKLEEVAKAKEDEAKKREMDAFAKAAEEVKKAALEMQKNPPPQEAALTKLNKMADRASAAARQLAGMKEPKSPEEMSAQDKALSDLLQDLSNAGIESLAKDVRDLEQRLKADPKGDGAPSVDDIRALAARVDALKRALDRAKEAGAKGLEDALRAIGNEDLLEKIAQRMRELAAKLEKAGYEGLQGEGESGEGMSLDQLSREELEQLLKDLEQMAGMEDLSDLIRDGGSEARGGRKMRFRPGGKPGGT